MMMQDFHCPQDSEKINNIFFFPISTTTVKQYKKNRINKHYELANFAFI